jgi:hypothetical protein
MIQTETATARGYEVRTVDGPTTTVERFGFDWKPLEASVATSDAATGRVTIQIFDGDWKATGASIITDAADVFRYEQYDAAWNLVSAFVRHTSADGAKVVLEEFGPGWSLVGASAKTVSEQGDVITVEQFGPGWEPTSATVERHLEGRTVVEQFDANWRLEDVTIRSVGEQAGDYASTVEIFDGAWHIRSWSGYNAFGDLAFSLDY